MNDLSGRGPLGQKVPNEVSKAIRNSARGEECTLHLDCCTWDNEQTVYDHLRYFNQAGIGEKPDDLCGVYGCFACHNAIDGRSGDPWGYEDIVRAWMKTIKRLRAKGLVSTK
jgi:hypothetical protein